MDLSLSLQTKESDVSRQLNILIVDDEEVWREYLRDVVIDISYEATITYAKSVGDAKEMILYAEKEQSPFNVITIDRKFTVGKVDNFQGETIAKYIKKAHPYIAVIMVSAKEVTTSELLALIYKGGIDYYIMKEEVNASTLEEAIERVLGSSKVYDKLNWQREKIKQLITKNKENLYISSNNLADLRRKEALEGIDVSIKTRNEIRDCLSQIEEIKQMVQYWENELVNLG